MTSRWRRSVKRMIFIAPPHLRHLSGSIWHTRLINMAHVAPKQKSFELLEEHPIFRRLREYDRLVREALQERSNC